MKSRPATRSDVWSDFDIHAEWYVAVVPDIGSSTNPSCTSGVSLNLITINISSSRHHQQHLLHHAYHVHNSVEAKREEGDAPKKCFSDKCHGIYDRCDRKR